MKYSIERLPESRVAIDVEVEAEQVEKALNRAAQRISQRGRIPGFRPGKAPRRVVEARYGRGAVYEEAADDLIQQVYREILDRGEFQPVGQARIEKLNLEPFSFRLVIPVVPTVTLGDYHSLRFPEEIHETTDEDVQKALERLQAEQTIWKEPEPARPARSGDRLLVDLVGRAGEKEIEKRQQVEIVLGEPGLLPSFSESLIDARPGQTVEVTTTLPQELDDQELAGKAATYTVTVHTIKEPEVPALDDEFARSFNQEETLEELRGRLRRELEEAAREEAREKVLEDMLKAIIEGATVDMPQALVDEEVSSLYQEQADRVRGLQIPMARYLKILGKSEEDFRQDLRQVAPDRLRRYLALQEFIRAEGLTAKGEELRDHLEARLLAIARGELETPAVAPAEEAVAPVEEAARPAETGPEAIETAAWAGEEATRPAGEGAAEPTA